MEEIARLRNLKRMELEERLKRLEEVAGAKGWTETDIEADFDPEEWDKRMQGVFDDTYYNEVFLSISHRINQQEDKKKPKFDEIDISDLVEENNDDACDDNAEPDPQIPGILPTKREKLDRKRKIEEYLDEHIPFEVFHLANAGSNCSN